jgi:ketosteroid isomerase-like protein
MQSANLSKAAVDTNDVEILTQLNTEYVRAGEAKDVDWFDGHLAPDFMNSNPDGSLIDRKAFLTMTERGTGVSNVGAHDVIVRVIGDLGIIHARTTFNTATGKPGHGRYTDIWSRRDGRWVCVAAQVTRC